MPLPSPPLLLTLAFTAAVAATAHAVPATPTGLAGHVTGTESVRLTWTDTSTDEAGFIIGARLNSSSGFSGVKQVPANTVTVDIDELPAGTNIEFVVVAVDAAGGQSSFSNQITLTTLANFKNGYTGQAFTFSLSTPQLIPVSSFTASALPDGLELNPSTGAITGTPAVPSRVKATITAQVTSGGSITWPLGFVIYQPVPALQPPVAGAPLPDRILTPGGPPVTVSLTGLFSDPDVTSAVRVGTVLGNMDFAFYPEAAPQTVANFLDYVSRGDFTNTIFHRSVPGFVIQGGGFRADATASAVPTVAPVVNEPRITNTRGTLAMAKLGSNPDSATCQFFVSLANNAANLDNQNEGFTVFGRVAGTGMTVADAIAALPRGNYSSVNGVLTDTPVNVPAPAPAAYDPAKLAIVSAIAPVSPLTLTAESSHPAVAAVALTGTDLTLTPGAGAGTAIVTLTATDLDGQTAQSTLQVSNGDGYLQWAATQPWAQPADSSPEADPDQDGSVNLLEFLLGSPPLTPNGGRVLQPVLEDGRPGFTFSLTKSPLAGSTLVLESAESLDGPWTTRWTVADGFSHPWIHSRQEQDGYDLITVRDPGFPAAAGRQFLRLKGTRS